MKYPYIASKNLIATIRAASQKYKNMKKDMYKGKCSLPSFKGDQPIILDASSVKLSHESPDVIVYLSVFSQKYKLEHPEVDRLRFRIDPRSIKDTSQNAIMQRIISGDYKLSNCMLEYRKKKWFLVIGYSFEAQPVALDPDKILGVDLGESYAIFASSLGSHGFFKIEGGEVTAYAAKHEARIRSMQMQAAHCGEGRIGHGTKARVADIYKSKDKLSNFRDTIDHRYSKALIDYAVKNGYGTIQMEDLSGIKDDNDHPKFLRHWTYYDLQQKIKNKADEKGITVIKVPPRYTSQRCSRCGYIHKDNRKSQAQFLCLKCGFRANADYNASQNLSIHLIDKIIDSELKQMCEVQENS